MFNSILYILDFKLVFVLCCNSEGLGKGEKGDLCINNTIVSAKVCCIVGDYLYIILQILDTVTLNPYCPL